MDIPFTSPLAIAGFVVGIPIGLKYSVDIVIKIINSKMFDGAASKPKNQIETRKCPHYDEHSRQFSEGNEAFKKIGESLDKIEERIAANHLETCQRMTAVEVNVEELKKKSNHLM